MLVHPIYVGVPITGEIVGCENPSMVDATWAVMIKKY
jgi:hypothetical protein